MSMPAGTIAIVEDDPSVREATAALVESAGIEAISYETAEAFLNCDRSRSVSCVIADVQMPGMSGLELQQELRASGSRVPVIFVTSFPDDRVTAQALADGALACLSKPAQADELIGLVHRGLAVQV